VKNIHDRVFSQVQNQRVNTLHLYLRKYQHMHFERTALYAAENVGLASAHYWVFKRLTVKTATTILINWRSDF